MTEQSTYPHVPPSPRFPEIEERVLKYWDEDGTFVASVETGGPSPLDWHHRRLSRHQR